MKVLLVLLLALLAPPCTRAALPPCGPYTVAYYELGALYGRDADGQGQGIDKDVAEEVAKRSGCQFRTVVESRVRIWTQLAQGSLDMSVSGIPTPEREQFAEFIPYFASRNYAVMRVEQSEALSRPEAFLADARRTLAVVKSFRHGPSYDVWVGQLRAQNRVVEVADFEAALRLLLIGRVDAVLTMPIMWPRLMQQPGLMEQLRLLDWAPQERVVHGLIVSRTRVPPADRERLREAIASMRRDGSLDTIFKRHLGDAIGRAIRLEGP